MHARNHTYVISFHTITPQYTFPLWTVTMSFSAFRFSLCVIPYFSQDFSCLNLDGNLPSVAHADRYLRNVIPQGLSRRALATGCMNHSSVTSLDRTPEVVCQFHLDVISSMKSGVGIAQGVLTTGFYIHFALNDIFLFLTFL